ncbi:MAG: helix-turn-helix transcriptional regulator [bacterium]|nr:helix-turn-helix transcriptional regulator [bacterium]
MSDKNKNVGQGLKQIRTDMGLNQKNFAALLGISKSFVSEIEAGNKYPNLDLLTTLALKHNINTTFLITGKGSPYIRPGQDGYSPEDEAKRRQFLGDKMVNDIADLYYYIENSSMIRLAVMSHFVSYMHEKGEIIKEKIEGTESREQNRGNRIEGTESREQNRG